MPYSTLAKQRAAQRAYRQTPEGREAHRRSRERYEAKRRGQADTAWQINPAPLAQALNSWSRT